MANEDKQEKDIRNVNESILDQNEKVLNPNILVQEYIKEEFKDSFSEEQRKVAEAFIKNVGENIEYVKQLEGTPYNFTSEGLTYIDEEGNNVKVSNILIIPIKKYNYISGDEIKSEIELKGIIAPTGKELPTITESIKDIESCEWYKDDLWWSEIRFQQSVPKSIQIDSIKELCRDIKEETVYGFIGYTEIDGKTVYLSTNGAVGIDKDVVVDLGDENLNRFTLTNKKFDIKDTLGYSLQCLKVAPMKITLPIFALNWMAPLTSMFEELGIPIGFLMWVEGPSHSKKTSMVCGIASHFGFFDKNHTPMNFLDGVPSIGPKTAKCKDALLVADDYFPSSNKQEAANMRNYAEKLITACSEKMTGARNKSNGELRKTYRMKGQVIATGESFPDLSESRMSRVLRICVTKTDVNDDELRVIQNHQEELQYTMKSFIGYIIENKEQIKSEIPSLKDKKVKEAEKEVTNRTADILAGLYIGYSLFIEFAIANGVIKLEEKDTMLQEAWKILLELGKEQNKMVETESPMNMLKSAVESLTILDKLATVDIKSLEGMKQQDIMKTGFIGFYDEKKDLSLVYPDLLYREVKRFYEQQGIVFPWKQSTMCTELLTQGYLYATPKQKRPQITRKDPRTGRDASFLIVYRKKMYITCRYIKQGKILTK